jgi:hypothetical protein
MSPVILMLGQLIPPEKPIVANSITAREGAVVTRGIGVVDKCMAVSIASATKSSHARWAVMAATLNRIRCQSADSRTRLCLGDGGKCGSYGRLILHYHLCGGGRCFIGLKALGKRGSIEVKDILEPGVAVITEKGVKLEVIP